MSQKKKITSSDTSRRKRTQPSKGNRYHVFWKNKSKHVFFFAIFAISFYVFYNYLAFINVYLFKDIGSDTINSFYPKFVHIAEYLRSEGWVKWSFNQGMGQNIFPYSLGDPFAWLLFMIGSENLAYGIIYMELIKVLLGGYFFYLFLRTSKVSSYTSIIGGLLFAFSGLMILGGGWYTLSSTAVYLALFLLAFEKLLLEDSWWLFPISVGLIVAAMPVNLYLFGVFLLSYILFRISAIKNKGVHDLPKLFLKLTGLGLLGLALTSVFLVSNVIQILESPRVGGDASFFKTLSDKPFFHLLPDVHYVTTILRAFSSDMIGTGSNFTGWYNYLEAPLIYCGLISLLLAPQIFYFVSRRRKIIYLSFLIFWLLPVVFPFIRYAMWLFTGNYYRIFSAFVFLPILIYAIQALQRIEYYKKINVPLLFSTLGVLLLLLFYPYDVARIKINQSLQYTAAVFLLVYTVILFFMKSPKHHFFAQIALLLTICLELALFSSVTVNDRRPMSNNEFTQKIGYNDYTVDAVQFLKETDKSWYRLHKSYFSGLSDHTSVNDAKAQNYYSSLSYYAFNQKFYIEFLKETNAIEKGNVNQTRWSMGVQNRPLLQNLISSKYYLSKGDQQKLENRGFTLIKNIGGIGVYKNNYYMSLGFTYDSYLLEKDFRGLTNIQKDIALTKGCVLPSQQAEHFPFLTQARPESIPMDLATYHEDVNMRNKHVFNITNHKQNFIKGNIEVPEKKMMFFSIPFDKGWSATVDGKSTPLHLVNFGFMGLELDAGSHEVLLSYQIPYFNISVIMNFLALLVYFFLLRKFSKKQLPI